ncbi:MAG: SIS domain-containing protein [Terracoccus sp.]
MMMPESKPVSDNTVAGAENTTREIAQQPALWRQVPSRIEPGLSEFVGEIIAKPNARVVLTGAGTSCFAGQVLAPALRRTLNRRVDAVATTDVVADPSGCLGEDVPTLLVSFARSGDSPESVAAVGLADQMITDVRHLVLTCNPEGRLAREHGAREAAKVVLMPDGANDQGFAMTSSFTTMTLAALLVLAPTFEENLAVKVADIGTAVLSGGDAEIRELSQRAHERVVYLGSGALKGLARESALKLLELTAGQVVAIGDSPLAFRHGPKSILDHRTLVVVYLSNNPYTRTYDLDLLDELRQAPGGHEVIAVTADHSDAASNMTSWLVPNATALSDASLALPAVLFAQNFALHSSIARGLTADNPFPDGQVNRVVEGVRIHPFLLDR